MWGGYFFWGNYFILQRPNGGGGCHLQSLIPHQKNHLPTVLCLTGVASSLTDCNIHLRPQSDSLIPLHPGWEPKNIPMHIRSTSWARK
jgi:hypothetical protein